MHRRHRKNKENRRSRTSAKPILKTAEITTIGEFRAKYLPTEANLRTAQRTTPREVGEDLARASLSTAKQVLTGRVSTTVARRKSVEA
jgi:hypothetical protein